MKHKSLFALLIIVTFYKQAYSQWTGTNPITSNSFIGLGTTTPTSYLHIRPLYTGSYATLLMPLFQVEYSDNGTVVPILNVLNNSYVGIGTSDPLSKLHLNGGDFKLTNGAMYIYDAGTCNFKIDRTGLLYAREVKVNLLNIPPDYVFDKTYPLKTIDELEAFIKKYHHLPNIPSADEMTKEGTVNVGEFQMKLLEKMEELTLYVIELKKQNDALKERIKLLENK